MTLLFILSVRITWPLETFFYKEKKIELFKYPTFRSNDNDEFCITMPEKHIRNLGSILRSFSLEDIHGLQKALEKNLYHFAPANFFHKLCDRSINQRKH